MKVLILTTIVVLATCAEISRAGTLTVRVIEKTPEQRCFDARDVIYAVPNTEDLSAFKICESLVNADGTRPEEELEDACSAAVYSDDCDAILPDDGTDHDYVKSKGL